MKLKLISLILFLLAGCSLRPDEVVLYEILSSKYANLKVNEEYKKSVLKEIKILVDKKKKLNENFLDFESLIRKIGDAHLVLTSSKKKKSYSSGLDISIAEGVKLKTCPDCELQSLVKIDDLPIEDWLEKYKSTVYASSEHGRRYRVLKILEEHDEGQVRPSKIELADGHIVKLTWKPSERKELCVSGNAVNEKTYHLKIHSLWCGSFKKFQQSLDRRLDEAASFAHLVLDLRDNGGGGDKETRYLLSKLIRKKAFLYQYQYIGEIKKTDYLAPSSKITWKKIVGIINGGCFSSCEVVASVLKNSEGIQLVGENTHGAAGDPKRKTFSAANLLYPTCVVWQKNGQLYEGVGVSADFTSGHEYLSKALKLLN